MCQQPAPRRSRVVFTPEARAARKRMRAPTNHGDRQKTPRTARRISQTSQLARHTQKQKRVRPAVGSCADCRAWSESVQLQATDDGAFVARPAPLAFLFRGRTELARTHVGRRAGKGTRLHGGTARSGSPDAVRADAKLSTNDVPLFVPVLEVKSTAFPTSQDQHNVRGICF